MFNLSIKGDGLNFDIGIGQELAASIIQESITKRFVQTIGRPVKNISPVSPVAAPKPSEVEDTELEEEHTEPIHYGRREGESDLEYHKRMTARLK